MEDIVMTVIKHFQRSVFFILFMGLIAFAGTSKGEDDVFRIHISDVSRIVHDNWLGIPRSADCTVTWEIYTEKDSEWIPADVSSFSPYRVVCYEENDPTDQKRSNDVDGNFYTFNGLRTGVRFGFYVEGYRNGSRAAVSDTASAMSGKSLSASADGPSTAWYHWFPLNGRFPLTIIGRGSHFDESTIAGKVAFHINWYFFLAGLFIWLILCRRYIQLGRVFPLEKGVILGGYDEIYRKKESAKFKEIIEKWRDLIIQANQNIRVELSMRDNVAVNDIEGANVKFWRDKGTKEIHDLIEYINASDLEKYPSVKVIRAGLDNHELGGFHWLEVSREVDRAIENRASSELERLRRKSVLDWLWNLGTMAPLIGLFGTATGISHAFAQLTFLGRDITQTELVKRLAGGIYEALWTTIEGLAIGVTMMMLYYWYDRKLKWIYSKWEELYVYVSEKL